MCRRSQEPSPAGSLSARGGLSGGAEEEAALTGADLHVGEVAEELRQPVARVVEDRAVVDHLVAQLPDRALRPRPAREARDDGATGCDELAHPLHMRRGILDVVEVAE